MRDDCHASLTEMRASLPPALLYEGEPDEVLGLDGVGDPRLFGAESETDA